MYSASKSFTGALVGIAIQEGYIGGVDDLLSQYLPQVAQMTDGKEDLTLRHLLTNKMCIRDRGCAVAEVYDGFLHVKELLAPPECLPRAASALSRAFPGWRMEVRTRPDWGRFLDLPVREFAMARWAGEPLEGPAYFGLSLD